MGKMFKDKSWNEKTELERFQTIVDEFHEILWGTVRRPEKKFEGMMTKVGGGVGTFARSLLTGGR